MNGVPKISSAGRLHEWVMGQNLGKLGKNWANLVKIHLYLWVPRKIFRLHDWVGHLRKVPDLHLWGIGQKAQRHIRALLCIKYPPGEWFGTEALFLGPMTSPRVTEN